MELTSELKKLMIDCLFIAAQNKMLYEVDAIISALPLVIVDENDRILCESLCHIVSGGKSQELQSISVLSPELCERLRFFSNMLEKDI
ncbi:DUF1039 domain-containing protein [Citrobacter youngae]|uniref:Uncharacterized protein n=1 Tax=Citrobacter youngae ATCC 29220 TaxID=500640 RepID=D4BKF8_9ENTR|nr:DUF1039 domain-containing protein [Citrobacter youngae]EFE05589.1 hypothetical protein CIT292_11035 [Citrobacter youngae ATCC 29220]